MRSLALQPRSARVSARWALTMRRRCARRRQCGRRWTSGAPVCGGARTRRCRCGRCVPRSAWRTWREGSGPELSGRFAAIRVRVGRDGAEGEQTLLLEWGSRIRLAIGWSPWRARRPSRTSSPRPKVGRTKLPRTQARSRRLRGAGVAGLPSPPHPELRRLRLPGDAPLPAALARRRSGRGLKLSSGRGSHPSAHPTGTPRALLDPDHAPTPDLARRLPRCPCCQTPHSEQVLLIQPLLLSA
jgi:hypothetical protein